MQQSFLMARHLESSLTLFHPWHVLAPQKELSRPRALHPSTRARSTSRTVLGVASEKLLSWGGDQHVPASNNFRPRDRLDIRRGRIGLFKPPPKQGVEAVEFCSHDAKCTVSLLTGSCQ